MFHFGWQPGSATVVDSKIDMDAVMHVSGYWNWAFILDVQPDDGSALFRAEVRQRPPMLAKDPLNGDHLRVTFDPKSHKTKVDINALNAETQAQKDQGDAEWAAKAAAQPAVAHVPLGDDVVEGLEKLSAMHARGELTDAEFAASKAHIIDG